MKYGEQFEKESVPEWSLREFYFHFYFFVYLFAFVCCFALFPLKQ